MFTDTAIYTTIYPGVEPYFEDWKQSFLMQDDLGVDLFVGVDSLSRSQASSLLSGLPVKHVYFHANASKAKIRRDALREITKHYSEVILVDSDDCMHATRVSAAKQYLNACDVVACGMQLVNAAGVELNYQVGTKIDLSREESIVNMNYFGLSNTAYRSTVLEKGLLMPDDCVLFDWFLATAVWALGAEMKIDSDVRMYYRQYSNNTAKLLSPFSKEEIERSTYMAMTHYDLVLSHVNALTSKKKASIKQRQSYVENFYHRMKKNQDCFDRYQSQLNKIDCLDAWWLCVAHPELEEIWN